MCVYARFQLKYHQIKQFFRRLPNIKRDHQHYIQHNIRHICEAESDSDPV